MKDRPHALMEVILDTPTPSIPQELAIRISRIQLWNDTYHELLRLYATNRPSFVHNVKVFNVFLALEFIALAISVFAGVDTVQYVFVSVFLLTYVIKVSRLRSLIKELHFDMDTVVKRANGECERDNIEWVFHSNISPAGLAHVVAAGVPINITVSWPAELPPEPEPEPPKYCEKCGSPLTNGEQCDCYSRQHFYRLATVPDFAYSPPTKHADGEAQVVIDAKEVEPEDSSKDSQEVEVEALYVYPGSYQPPKLLET